MVSCRPKGEVLPAQRGTAAAPAGVFGFFQIQNEDKRRLKKSMLKTSGVEKQGDPSDCVLSSSKEDAMQRR